MTSGRRKTHLEKILVRKSAPLKGEVCISGAKNAVLPIMAAALLTEEKCVIHDTPALRDVEIMRDILKSMGVSIEDKLNENIIEIQTEDIKVTDAPLDLVKQMRASILVLGPVLARKGHASVPLPGGCAIGKRPIELHLKGLKALGADIISGYYDNDTRVEAHASKLKGANIYLDFPSVGATEVIITAAVLAEGTTVIENAAQEPEIVDLANFLNKIGAKIRGAGTDTIKIDGVKSLRGTDHNIIPDRIEAGTYMVAAAITKGDVLIKNAVESHIKPIIAKLRECGVQIETTDLGLRVRGDVAPLVATDIKTLPYPGFPTDMQSPFMALLTVADGASVVQETVFENRYMHVAEFNRMGAGIILDGHRAFIPGGKKLKGTKVIATDLRAGAAVILAGLVAEGTMEITEIFHVDRGYENLVGKFKGLGADIERIEDV